MQDQEPTASPSSPGRRALTLAILLAVLAAGFAALVWLDSRDKVQALQDEFARRVREVESDARDARVLARRADEAQREAQARIAQLDQRVSDQQSRQLALDALYQELSRSRDEWQLAEIEQVLAIASQQLQLSGNVRAALLALQLAESRLSRNERPQFLPIRRAIERDIERLQAVPALDLPGLSLRIGRLAAGVDQMPLAYEVRMAKEAAAAVPPVAPPDPGFWSRLGSDIWTEVKQMVTVRRIDAQEPPLLPPDQAFFVRENLRLRLLSARLALQSRDEADYREDLRAAHAWTRKYFDPRARQTVEALNELRALSSASLSFEMPTIQESLDAVRGYKSRRGRSS